MCLALIRESGEVVLLGMADVVKINPRGSFIPELEVFAVIAVRAKKGDSLRFLTRGYLHTLSDYTYMLRNKVNDRNHQWLRGLFSEKQQSGSDLWLVFDNDQVVAYAKQQEQCQLQYGRVKLDKRVDVEYCGDEDDMTPMYSKFSVEFKEDGDQIFCLRYYMRPEVDLERGSRKEEYSILGFDNIFEKLLKDIERSHANAVEERARLLDELKEYQKEYIGASSKKEMDLKYKYDMLLINHPESKTFELHDPNSSVLREPPSESHQQIPFMFSSGKSKIKRLPFKKSCFSVGFSIESF